MPVEPPSMVRRSTRSKQIPKKLDGFKLDGKVKYGIEKVINYSKLFFNAKCFISSLNKSVEPKSFVEACKDINWVNAMNLEIEALNRNGTWLVVDLP